jgi:hypothetical protein
LDPNGTEETERKRSRKGEEANTTEEGTVRRIRSNGKEIRKQGTKESRQENRKKGKRERKIGKEKKKKEEGNMEGVKMKKEQK